MKKLEAYTFKLSSPCAQGTTWILDYQLPKDTDKDKYPTVFYFATTLDVIKKWVFESNSYNQKLPISVSEFNQRTERHLVNKENTMKNLLNDQYSCAYLDQYGLFDISITQGETSNKLEGLLHSKKIKKPKLFYSGVGFWKERKLDYGIQKYNYKDFAVIEIEFTNSQYAREITNKFAEIYIPENKNSIINVFSNALDISKVDTNDSNYYGLAFSESKVGQKTKRVSNWREGEMTSSQLSNDYPHIYVGTKGHIPQDKVLLSRSGLAWGNGISYWESGHFYLTKGNSLGKGSSGSISIDKNGNLLGIKNGQENRDYSLFTPLRSNEINNGRIRTPKYDLILGAEGQKSSYKEQVETHIIGKRKGKTWLSTFDEWKNSSSSLKTT